jgi:hypothetical protein
MSVLKASWHSYYNRPVNTVGEPPGTRPGGRRKGDETQDAD